ncbi:programmed cell death protein 7 [Pseudophryne corroboree]|uniref:programmed cell death protein 7 n=1 Tax=Pseudophryne corroboree TaxID=495146 RepID=UPI003081FF3B
MERRQRLTGCEQWDRPRYGGSQANLPATFHGEASQYPTARSSGGPRHSRPPQGRTQHSGDTRQGLSQHGAPQYRMHPQEERLQSGAQHGGLPHESVRPQQLISPHSGVLQTNVHGDPKHGGPSSVWQNGGPLPNISQQRGGQRDLLQHGSQQHDFNSISEGSSGVFQHGRPQQSMLDYTKASTGIPHARVPEQSLMEYRRETQGMAQDRNLQQDLSCQRERLPDIAQHRGFGVTVSPHDTQQPGMSQPGNSLSRGAHFGVLQHGSLHHDLSEQKDAQPRGYQLDGSQHGASFTGVLLHGDPQQNAHWFGDHKPGISPFGGSQTEIFNTRASVNRPVLNDASHYRAPSPGIIQQCSTPLQPVPPQITPFRAPSPGIIQQCSTPLQPVPPQISPFVDNVVQGHHNFPPPFHGNLSNPSFPAPPPMGSVFSGYHKESDLKVPPLQTQVHEPQNVFNQDRLTMQKDDRFENRDLFNLHQRDGHFLQDPRHGHVPSERVAVQNKPPSQNDSFYEHNVTFLHQEIPDLQRDPHLVNQHRFSEHGGPFVLHNNPDLQVDDRLMHLNRQSAPLSGTDGEMHKDSFQQWLSSFFTHRRKKPPPKTCASQSVSITEARGLIYGAVQLVSQLDSLCQTLENGNEEGESWTLDYEKASDIRIALERKLKDIEKPGYIQDVKKKLDRVRKKRLRWQRRRQATEEEEKQAMERASEKEAAIDRWRTQCIQAVEEKKRERELKAAADSVLAEVRKKQTDTKKMLDVLKSLEKLRKLRKEAAGRKGVFPPASADETFKNHINRLRTMVHKRVALYDAEERALRVILEGEQEEERQRDKDKRLKKEREKVLQKQRELDAILFGDPDPLPNLHPLQPFRQYYLQAEHSVVSLVQIRHMWDQFLAPPEHPDASSIPRGWVGPTLPSSDIWATALKQAE